MNLIQVVFYILFLLFDYILYFFKKKIKYKIDLVMETQNNNNNITRNNGEIPSTFTEPEGPGTSKSQKQGGILNPHGKPNSAEQGGTLNAY